MSLRSGRAVGTLIYATSRRTNEGTPQVHRTSAALGLVADGYHVGHPTLRHGELANRVYFRNTARAQSIECHDDRDIELVNIADVADQATHVLAEGRHILYTGIARFNTAVVLQCTPSGNKQSPVGKEVHLCDI